MKSGKCTNIDCEKFGETIELQEWEDMICQEEECGQELMEVADSGGGGVKKYAVIAAVVMALGLAGFGGYTWLGSSDVGEEEIVDTPPESDEPLGSDTGAFASIEDLMKQVASPDHSDREVDGYIEEVLAMCDNPNIEVRLVNLEGIVTEKLPVHLFLDRLRVLQEANFEVKTIYPTTRGDKVATLEIIETNVG
jgi:hypothetical protein